MGFLFNTFVYDPIYNLLIFVYNIIPFHDFGIAIILVTIIIKFLLLPISKKQIESQKKLQELQPKIKELQTKYKNDKEKQTKALMELYKTHKTNPFSGCLPLIFQLIFFIAIYRVLINISGAGNGLIVDQESLYSFIHNPGAINHLFLNVVDMSKAVDFGKITLSSLPHIVLVLLSAVAQYSQTKMLMPKTEPVKNTSEEPDFSQVMSKQMLYVGPLLTLFIGLKFPAGLALYWLTTTAFAILQQIYIEKKKKVEAPVVK